MVQGQGVGLSYCQLHDAAVRMTEMQRHGEAEQQEARIRSAPKYTLLTSQTSMWPMQVVQVAGAEGAGSWCRWYSLLFRAFLALVLVLLLPSLQILLGFGLLCLLLLHPPVLLLQQPNSVSLQFKAGEATHVLMHLCI